MGGRKKERMDKMKEGKEARNERKNKVEKVEQKNTWKEGRKHLRKEKSNK